MEPTLQQLKIIAQKLNLTHSPNIGFNTLKEKIEARCKELGVIYDMEALLNMQAIVNSTSNSPSTPSGEQTGINTQTSPDNASTTSLDPSTDGLTMDSPDGKAILNDEMEKLKNLTFHQMELTSAKVTEAEQLRDANRLIRVTVICNNPNKKSWVGEIFSVRNAAIPEIKKFVPFNVKTHIPQIMLNMIKEKQCQVYRKEKPVNGVPVTRTKLIAEYNIEIHPPITEEELMAIRKKQLAEGFTGE